MTAPKTPPPARGIKLSELKAREKAAQVTYDGEVVDFGYFPNQFTMELSEEIAEAAEASEMKAVTDLLEPVISWWDVLDDKGQRIPATAAAMKSFPVPFLMAIMGAIQDAQLPPESEA